MGWARGEPCTVPTFGVLRFPKSADGDWDEWLATLHDFWSNEILAFSVREIGYEPPFFEAGKSDLAYFIGCHRLLGILQYLAWQHRIVFRPAPMASWRKKLLGVSQAPKEIKKSEDRTRWLKAEAIKACHARGWMVALNDEAEGCGVWNLLASEASGKHDALNIASAPLFAR